MWWTVLTTPRVTLLVTLFLDITSSYKIAIFVPDISNSHIIFSIRVAEHLTSAGHDLTLIRIKTLSILKTKDFKVNDSIKVWKFVMNETEESEEYMRLFEETIFKETVTTISSLLSSKVRKLMSTASGRIVSGCEAMLEDKKFIQRIADAKFDLAFAHMADFCPIGIIHHTKIPAWIWLNAGPLMDIIAYHIGVPSPPSYVPPVATDGSDELTFFERLKSFVGWALIPPISSRIVIDPETAIFRKHFGENFPDLLELAKSCPLVMVNTNEIYNLPRPTLHKVVNIGGIGMNFDSAKPLTGHFKELYNNASGVVLFSLGTVANASLMPSSWKKAFLTSFREFPSYEFIFRYEGNDLNGKLPPNVHIFKWIPQRDLLLNDKTKAFISHGGYNSIQEAIISATPIIVLPLFGDQSANAHLAKKRGFGIIVRKDEVSGINIYNAIKDILHSESYAKAAKRLQGMVMRKPTKPEELLVKWTEFVAEFKQLPNLTPYSVHLNFFVYHSLDVIIFLTCVAASIAFMVSFLFRLCYAKIAHIIKKKSKFD